MKKFIDACGWGYVFLFVLLTLMITFGFGAFVLGLYGWFQGDYDLIAYIGMGAGFLIGFYGIIKFDKIKDEAKEMIAEEEI